MATSLSLTAILETERLVLRPLAPSDEDAMFDLLGDPIAMQWYPRPLSREEAREWIDRNRRRFEEYGGGLFGLVLKENGELVGDCGPTRHEIEGRQEIEIGYHLRRAYWNRGLATEAARACTRFAFERLKPQRVISMIRPENVQSRRVAEKNGLVLEKMIWWRDYEHCVYQLTASTWADTWQVATEQNRSGRETGL